MRYTNPPTDITLAPTVNTLLLVSHWIIWAKRGPYTLVGLRKQSC